MSVGHACKLDCQDGQSLIGLSSIATSDTVFTLHRLLAMSGCNRSDLQLSTSRCTGFKVGSETDSSADKRTQQILREKQRSTFLLGCSSDYSIRCSNRSPSSVNKRYSCTACKNQSTEAQQLRKGEPFVCGRCKPGINHMCVVSEVQSCS